MVHSRQRQPLARLYVCSADRTCLNLLCATLAQHAVLARRDHDLSLFCCANNAQLPVFRLICSVLCHPGGVLRVALLFLDRRHPCVHRRS